jgi:glycosyltransferase involved in cell wall biosynthesis
MTDEPPRSLVSVGIPVYNGERYIAAALDSVLAQDYPHVEIVISDNASTDRTRAICKQYARRDPRIRYRRNQQNLGASANFKKVAKLARGEYFTWLAADDVLVQADYLSTLARYLDENADVVLCGSSVEVVIEEDPRAGSTYVLDGVAPDREWREARKEFFRWPQTANHHVIYGLYRREQLLKVPIGGRVYRGEPVVLDIEYPILSGMANFGRIVALPDVSRGYRSHAFSSAMRDIERLSKFSHFWLATTMKYHLFKRALSLDVPRVEKLELIRLTLSNFLHQPSGRMPEFRQMVHSVRREAAWLRGMSEYRLEVIHRQQDEIVEQHEVLARQDLNLRQLVERIAELEAELAAVRGELTELDGTEFDGTEFDGGPIAVVK